MAKRKPLQISPERDWEPYMSIALEQAKIAESKEEVPVGAVLVNAGGEIVGRAHNRRELDMNPMAHAECLLLDEASKIENNWRLWGYTLVVTLEPCVMCAGAISLARVDRVVFGAYDERAGAMGSTFKIHQESCMKHSIEVVGGVMEKPCQDLLLNFFRQRRK